MAEDRGDRSREGDIILTPNEFMYVMDKTKGYIDTHVGPSKLSLSNTDQTVVYNEKTKGFAPVDDSMAKQLWKTAPEGWYAILKNPSSDGLQPSDPGKNSSKKLQIGHKVNIPGPISFSLWPGQMAKVLRGHHLRSNQYLIVAVYNEEEARKNWQRAVMKPAAPVIVTQTGTDDDPQRSDPAPQAPQPLPQPSMPSVLDAAKLTMGQHLVIRGTDVSFYIPPTGVAVVPDENGELVREAVTLERLEYCLLLDESGNKRYERGPAVVFPDPTEIFAEQADGARKSRAIELAENQGIYLKVIADYSEGGKDYKVGNELFITGKEQMIYFPREEHAIIRYDQSEIHFGVAIPAGEARYVLDRNAGVVALQRGPDVFLPDPRKQVIVRRVLDHRTCTLLYPGNLAALAHNASLLGVDLGTYMSQNTATGSTGPLGATGPQGPQGPSLEVQMLGMVGPPGLYAAAAIPLGDSARSRGLAAKPGRSFAGSEFDRKTKFSEPRSITLPTKYEGAVSVNIHSGYAMMLVRSDGKRRVALGPETVLLEYDEVPEVMELSTGKPKTTDKLKKDVYLRVKANKISDIISVDTKDFCNFEVKVSYRMNFEGEPEKWFGVENYVKFLCDHVRSRLKAAVRAFGVEEFFAHSAEIIRDIVLGEAKDGVARPGMRFAENGMHVYDVEVLGVTLKDQKISDLISSTQRGVIESTLALAGQRRKLSDMTELEEIKQRMAELTAGTTAKELTLSAEIAKKRLESDLVTIEANAKAESEKLAKQLEAEKARNSVADASRKRGIADEESRIELDTKRQQIQISLIEAEVESLVKRAAAISPDLIAALDAFGDRVVAEKVISAMAPMSLLGGGSAAEIVSKVIAGTSLAKVLTNGSLPASTSPAASQPRT